MTTNLTPEMHERFLAIQEGHGLALFSAFLDGEPVGAIVSIGRGEEDGGDYTIVPLAVIVTDAMAARLTDHDGVSPQDLDGASPQEGATT